MANIVLCRIDSRLIHGQVVTKWVGQSQANRIAVVSDELDADPFMKNIHFDVRRRGHQVDVFHKRIGIQLIADHCNPVCLRLPNPFGHHLSMNQTAIDTT